MNTRSRYPHVLAIGSIQLVSGRTRALYVLRVASFLTSRVKLRRACQVFRSRSIEADGAERCDECDNSEGEDADAEYVHARDLSALREL